MKRFLKNILIFLLVYIIAVQVYKLIVKPSYWKADTTLNIKYQEYTKNIEKYNTLFLGSSRVYRHVNPSVFDQKSETNTISFNFGLPATANPETYFLVERLLEEKKSELKTIFLEITPYSMIQTQNMGKIKSYYWLDWNYLKFCFSNIKNPDWSKRKKLYTTYTCILSAALKLINPSMKTTQTLKDFESISSAMKNGYLSLENEVLVGETTLLSRKNKLLNDHSILKGKKETSINSFNHLAKEYNVKAHLSKIRYLKKKCEEKNIKLVFLILPRYPNYKEVINVMKKATDLEFIELADGKEYPEFYQVNFSFDNGHLNESGAVLFSEILARKYNLINQ